MAQFWVSAVQLYLCFVDDKVPFVLAIFKNVFRSVEELFKFPPVCCTQRVLIWSKNLIYITLRGTLGGWFLDRRLLLHISSLFILHVRSVFILSFGSARFSSFPEFVIPLQFPCPTRHSSGTRCLSLELSIIIIVFNIFNLRCSSSLTGAVRFFCIIFAITGPTGELRTFPFQHLLLLFFLSLSPSFLDLIPPLLSLQFFFFLLLGVPYQRCA
mmetsp:Transcript_10429/g.15112  ORF Transcript_10429/g.15112 Transcript_10429/m.15112 type:complete len:213 (-) Transcript_10429:907-1545(-)